MPQPLLLPARPQSSAVVTDSWSGQIDGG